MKRRKITVVAAMSAAFAVGLGAGIAARDGHPHPLPLRFYVDPQTGSNSNAGTNTEAPLLDLREAGSRVGKYPCAAPQRYTVTIESW
jgi:hypothetical protein